MDAQELCNLQEAYMEVYETTDIIDNPRMWGANAPGGGGKKNPSKKIKTGATSSGHSIDIIDKPKMWGSNNNAKDRVKKEQVDIYDIILSHLIDEGYADTNKAALAIMANMSEEWKQSIVEEVLDEELTGPRAERAREIMATASKGKAKALNRVLKSREGSTAPGGQPSANIKGDGSEQKLPTKRGGGGIRGRAKVTTIGGSKMDQRRGNRATRRAGEEVEDTSDEN